MGIGVRRVRILYEDDGAYIQVGGPAVESLDFSHAWCVCACEFGIGDPQSSYYINS